MSPEQFSHLYDRLPLCGTGIIMGAVLALLHLAAVIYPEETKKFLNSLHLRPKLGIGLMVVNFAWILLLLADFKWNPLCMPLFSFEAFRWKLFFVAIPVCGVLCCYSREHIFARALGLFLLLAAIVPLSAAFLKDPVTRLLIPIWWYPVLTAAMFLVAKPYLLRDWAAALSKHPKVYLLSAWLGLGYAVAIMACAILFW